MWFRWAFLTTQPRLICSSEGGCGTQEVAMAPLGL